MSDEPKILQSIIPSECPHCLKPIFIAYQMMPPSLVKTFKPEESNAAKEEIKKKIEEITFKRATEKKEVLEWLADENTLLSLGDVEPILQRIVANNTQ